MTKEDENIIVDYLFLKLGLYMPIEFNEENFEPLGDKLILDDLQFDCYCVECKKESTFKSYRRGNISTEYGSFGRAMKYREFNSHNDTFSISFKCQRMNDHIYSFYYRVANNKIVKVGQYPSIADLQIHDIKKYRKVLKDDYRDFSKAIGLFANGIGIGSYVYLRRIFENLIEESRQEAQKDKSWDDEKFKQSRMDEKIQLLKRYIPEFLYEHRQIYGIISKGIHELSEDECNGMFPNIKLAIELILDEKLNKIERESKIKNVSKFISEAAEALKK